MAFLVGQPNWSVSIAVLKNAEPVVGLVYAPVRRELYVGQADRGATLNGRSLSIKHDWTISSTTIGYGGTERADPIEVGAFVTRLYQEGGVLFRVGSGAVMLAYVPPTGLLVITTRPFTVGIALLVLRLSARQEGWRNLLALLQRRDPFGRETAAFSPT